MIGKNQLIPFGEGRVLTLYSEEVRSTYLRPLAWLDPDTLKETKIPGLEKEGRSHLMFDNTFVFKSFAELSQNRMLMLNQH